MNLKALNELIDSQAVVQSNIFSQSIKDYEEIYNYIVNDATEVSKDDVENFRKKINSIQRPFAEFCASILSNMDNPNDDILLRGLIDKAIKAQKYDYSTYFCQVAINLNSANKYALNMKAVSLKKNNASIAEQKQAIEDYLELDMDDTKFLFELAQLHKEEGKIQNAIIDLKKAIQRAIQKKDFQELKINTLELDSLLEENNKSYITSTLSRGAKKIGGEKINALLFELERRNTENLDYSIKLLKEMLSLDPKNTKARMILVEQYQKLYQNSEHCQNCLKKSGLCDDINNSVVSCISSFEKLIQFSKGAFVLHSTHSIGRIVEVDENSLVINFLKKPGHRMSTAMALKSLTVLSKDDIRVLKQFANREKLHSKITTDPRWALITLIKSGDNSFRAMKAELCPDILSATEFQDFNEKAKKIIKSDAYISVSISKSDEYIVRDNPITHEEKFALAFKNESNIFERMKILRNFLETEGDMESDSFASMLGYFQNFLKSKISANLVYAYLFLCEIESSRQKVKLTSTLMPNSPKEVFKAIPMGDNELIEWYLAIQDSTIQKKYLEMIIASTTQWQKIIGDIFLKAPNTIISSLFKKEGIKNFDDEMMKKSIYIAKQNPDVFLHYYKLGKDYKDWKSVCKSEYEFISVQLDILDTFSQKSATIKDIQQNLIAGGVLKKYIEKEQTYISSLYDIISTNKGIADEPKANLKNLMFTLSPELKEKNKPVKETSGIPNALLCKQSTYNAKKAELEHLVTVEIPKNAEDIGRARELGDLKENAEYQYAKEKQKLLNVTTNKLDEELSRAQVVKKEDIDESKVCYGVQVGLLNSDGSKVKYTILGPWESKPDENIISFTSPLGRKLYNRSVGESMQFSLNNNPYDFKIESIKAVDVS